MMILFYDDKLVLRIQTHHQFDLKDLDELLLQELTIDRKLQIIVEEEEEEVEIWKTTMMMRKKKEKLLEMKKILQWVKKKNFSNYAFFLSTLSHHLILLPYLPSLNANPTASQLNSVSPHLSIAVLVKYTLLSVSLSRSKSSFCLSPLSRSLITFVSFYA